MPLEPEHCKLAAYFNLDNRSGKIQCIQLQARRLAVAAAAVGFFAGQGAQSI